MRNIKLPAEMSIQKIEELSDLLRCSGNTVFIEGGTLYVKPVHNEELVTELASECQKVTTELSSLVAAFEALECNPDPETIKIIQSSTSLLENISI